jgi:hypothetical protein
VKERRKPDPLRQSREIGGGLAFEIHRFERSGGSSGHSSVEGVSGRKEAALLTERRGEAALAAGSGSKDPGLVRDRGRQRSTRTPRSRKTTPRIEGRPFEGSPISEPTRIQGRQHRRIGGGVGGTVGRSAVRVVKCETPRRIRRSLLRWMVTNHESDTDTPGIGRSTAGARDVGRLQKSVRSTFSVLEAASQGVGSKRGSVRRMPESSDGGGLHRSTRIGAGEPERRPNKFSRRLTTAVARPRAEPMEGVSGRRVVVP